MASHVAGSLQVAILLLVFVHVMAQEEEMSFLKGRGVIIVNHNDSEESYAEIKNKYKFVQCNLIIAMKDESELYYITSKNFGDSEKHYQTGESNCTYIFKGSTKCTPAMKCDHVDLRTVKNEYLDIKDEAGGELHLVGSAHVHNYSLAGTSNGFKIEFKTSPSTKFRRHYDGYLCQLRCYKPCPQVLGVDEHCLTSKYSNSEAECTNPLPKTYHCEEDEHEVVIILNGNTNCSEIPQLNVPLHPNQTQRIKFRVTASTRKPSLDFLWLADASSTFRQYLRSLANASSNFVSLIQEFSEDYQFGFVTYQWETDRIFDTPTTCDNRRWEDKYMWTWEKKRLNFYGGDKNLKYAPFLYENGDIVGGFSFRKNMALTSDSTVLSQLPRIMDRAPKIFGTISRTFREDLLTALNQAIICDEVNFRTKSKKIILITTDQFAYFNNTNSEIRVAALPDGEKVPNEIFPLDYGKCYLGVNQQNHPDYVSLPDFALPTENPVFENVKAKNVQIILAVIKDSGFECYEHITHVLYEFQGFQKKFGATVVTFDKDNPTSIFSTIRQAYVNLAAKEEFTLIIHQESPVNQLLSFTNLDGASTVDKVIQCKKLKQIKKSEENYDCELEIQMKSCSGNGVQKVGYTLRLNGQPDLLKLNFHLFC